MNKVLITHASSTSDGNRIFLPGTRFIFAVPDYGQRGSFVSYCILTSIVSIVFSLSATKLKATPKGIFFPIQHIAFELDSAFNRGCSCLRNATKITVQMNCITHLVCCCTSSSSTYRHYLQAPLHNTCLMAS